MVHRSVFRFKSFYSDVVHLPCPGTPRATILLLPGNPGLIDYYEGFLRDLQGFSNGLDIYGISHLGHTTRSPRSRGIATLSDQVDSKLEFLSTLASPNRPLILLGHSVGSWIAVQMLKSLAQGEAILLFPTLSNIAMTPNGRQLKYLFTWPAILLASWLAWFLSFFPAALLALLARGASGHSAQACSITVSLLTKPALLKAVLSMASEEMMRIKQLDPFVADLAPRLTALWAQKGRDLWTPQSEMDAFDSAAPGRSHRTSEDLPHAFVCRDAHSKHVARLCNSLIQSTMQ